MTGEEGYDSWFQGFRRTAGGKPCRRVTADDRLPVSGQPGNNVAMRAIC
jgi:hypothetical protein